MVRTCWSVTVGYMLASASRPMIFCVIRGFFHLPRYRSPAMAAPAARCLPVKLVLGVEPGAWGRAQVCVQFRDVKLDACTRQLPQGTIGNCELARQLAQRGGCAQVPAAPTSRWALRPTSVCRCAPRPISHECEQNRGVPVAVGRYRLGRVDPHV